MGENMTVTMDGIRHGDGWNVPTGAPVPLHERLSERSDSAKPSTTASPPPDSPPGHVDGGQANFGWMLVAQLIREVFSGSGFYKSENDA